MPNRSVAAATSRFRALGLGELLDPVADAETAFHGGRAMLRDVRENLPQLRDALRELPAALQQLREQAGSGRLQLGVQSPALEKIEMQLAEQRRQRFWLAVAATAVVAGAVLLSVGPVPWLGWLLLGAGLVCGIAAK